jgi:ribulose kinase
LDVGTSDVRIVVTNTNTGSGVGAITVEYIQNRNLL